MQTPPKVLTPLGIIFLFVALAETVLGVGITQTNSFIQGCLAIFACVFPTGVAAAFFYILYHRPENFYAPKDFGGDASYLQSMNAARASRIRRFSQAATTLQNKIEEEVRTITLRADLGDPLKRQELSAEEARRVTKEIRDLVFLTIDLSPMDSSLDTISLPVAAYGTLNDLTDELFFILSEHVRPYAYGYDWVLRKKDSQEVIESRRMIDVIPVGLPAPDNRSLSEVGIEPGAVLEVIRPAKAPNKL